MVESTINVSKPRSHRPSHATVVAYVALFVALGGSSYAAIKITSKNVPKDALTGADIKNLTGKDVRNNSLTGADVKNLTGGDVANGRLLAQDFAPGQLPKGDTGERGPVGPSAVYEVQASDVASAVGAGDDRRLTLSGLPAGSYAIFGKGQLVPTSMVDSNSSCTLRAGGRTDTAYEKLDTSAAYLAHLTPHLTQTFGSAGTVTMDCTVLSSTWSIDPQTRITAIRVDSRSASVQTPTDPSP